METEINIYILLGMLLVHWFADFVLQTDKQAKGKSTSWACLLEHTMFYSLFWFIVILLYSCIADNVPSRLMLFPLITFILHTITDFYTSRINSSLWKRGKVHNFFVSVGFDQWLHYVQLILTFQILS